MSWGVPDTPVTTSGYLVTLDDIKLHLGVTDTTDDDLLAQLLEMAQDALGEEYRLPTVPQVNESRYFQVDGWFIPLEECSSVSSVADVDGNALSYTTIKGRRTSDPLSGVQLYYSADGTVVITGTWGFAVAPANVGRAILVTVSTWYKRAKLGDANDVIGGFTPIPREARELMSARRPASI